MTRPNLKPIVRTSGVAAAFFWLAFGCPNLTPLDEALQAVTYKSLTPFGSDSEFDDYVAAVRDVRGKYQGWGSVLFGCSDNQSAAAPRSAETDSDPSITNNQELGVDEGDIVKASGDFLIVLRRGRLFSVRLAVSGAEIMAPVFQTNAYAPGYTDGTWYDEMLIHDQRIVVVGYSYQVDATEVGLFKLHDDGSIAHETTFFLRSNDYYSSRNYASRLVDGQLIFYLPYYLFEPAAGPFDPDVTLPSMRRWKSANDVGGWERMIEKRDVLRPVQPTMTPTLHTVVHCDLEAAEVACTARSVIGPYARTFYVSPSAVYIWVSPGYESWNYDENGDRDAAAPTASYVYRMPLDGSATQVLSALGTPIDQFSFKESAEHLNVLLSSAGSGDGMWGSGSSQGELHLLRTPLSNFAEQPQAVPDADYRPLASPTVSSSYLINRFVGEQLLYAEGNEWSYGGTETAVYVVDAAGAGAALRIPLEHGVSRIEALSRNAVVVGQSGDDLQLSTVALGAAPAVVDVLTRTGAAQGETRSHGFFFRPRPDGGGLLGLPVRLYGAGYEHLYYGSAEVLFADVSAALGFSELGSLAAHATERPEDGCQKSCVDWYGNARPIFLGDRILALLGYELIEGRLAETGIQEIGRVDYLISNRVE